MRVSWRFSRRVFRIFVSDHTAAAIIPVSSIIPISLIVPTLMSGWQVDSAVWLLQLRVFSCSLLSFRFRFCSFLCLSFWVRPCCVVFSWFPRVLSRLDGTSEDETCAQILCRSEVPPDESNLGSRRWFYEIMKILWQSEIWPEVNFSVIDRTAAKSYRYQIIPLQNHTAAIKIIIPVLKNISPLHMVFILIYRLAAPRCSTSCLSG